MTSLDNILFSEQQRRADRLLTQQCLARRFKHRHEQDYIYIQKIRSSIYEVLDGYGLKFATDYYGISIATAIVIFLSLFETKSGRKIIRSMDVTRATSRLGKGNFGLSWIVPDGVADILEKLGEFLEGVEDLKKKYNYFDYLSLSSLLCYCRGEKLYFRNSTNKFSSRDIDPIRQEWLQQPANFDVAFAINTSKNGYYFNSPSIEILYSRDNPSLTSLDPERNSIYLKVDLERAPSELDLAIRYFGESVLELLIDEHGFMANVPNHEEFLQSKFMNSKPIYTPVFYRQDQIKGTLLGLWCWDLINLDKLKEDAAIRSMLPNTRNKPSESAYADESTIKKHYKIVRALIEPEKYNSKSKSKISIDEAITGNPSKKIGLR